MDKTNKTASALDVSMEEPMTSLLIWGDLKAVSDVLTDGYII